MGWTLAIDFGTTNTSATYTREGSTTPERVRLGSSTDSMPSAVLVDSTGIRVGDSAVHARRVRPEAFVEAPKSLLGHRVTHVAGADHEVAVLVGRVMAHVAKAAARSAGSETPDRVVLTHPQDWAAHRREALVEAWRASGVTAGSLDLVSEPVAAASWLVSRPHVDLQPGARVAVVDYGGGTCDVSVLRWAGDGDRPWHELGSAGAPHVGGMAVDQALLSWVREALHRRDQGEIEEALAAPENIGALRTLLDEVRRAKEVLSESDQADIPVAVGSHSTWVSITAEEFEAVIAGEIAKVRALTERALSAAGMTGRDLDTLFLTGGSSLMRPVHSAMSQILGQRPATLDDPKFVVALGAPIAPATSVSAPAPAPEASVADLPRPEPRPTPQAETAPPPQPTPQPEPAPQPQPPPEQTPRPEPEPQPLPTPRPKPTPRPEVTPRPEPAGDPAHVHGASGTGRSRPVRVLAAVGGAGALALTLLVVGILAAVRGGSLPPPTGLVADTTSTPGEVGLSWDAVEGADRYRVCRSATSCEWVRGTSTTVTPGGTYDVTYRVAAATNDDETPQLSDEGRWARVSARAEAAPASAAAVRLVGRFSEAFVDRATCVEPGLVGGVSRSQSEREDAEIVATTCTSGTDGATEVTLLSFPTASGLADALSEQVAENETGDAICEGGDGTWQFSQTQETVGDLRCIDLGTNAAIAWTYETARVLVVAERRDAQPGDLLTWWGEQAVSLRTGTGG